MIKLKLSYAERVTRGVKFLDRKVGRNVWLPRVNASRLNVDVAGTCPLAQATESTFWRAADRFGLAVSGPLAVRTYWLGFIEHPSDVTDGLTREWRERVAALQAEVVVKRVVQRVTERVE